MYGDLEREFTELTQPAIGHEKQGRESALARTIGQIVVGESKGKTARVLTARVMAAWVLLSLALVVPPESAIATDDAITAADAAEEPFKVVGRLPVFSPEDRVKTSERSWDVKDAMLVLNPARRRGYQFFNAEGPGVRIRSFDLDSLEPLRSVRFDGRSGATLGEWTYGHDQRAGRIYLFLFQNPPLTSTNDPKFEIAILDEDLIERGRNPVVARLTAPPEHQVMVNTNRNAPSGLTFVPGTEPGSGKLLLYLRGHVEVPSIAALPSLAQWDARTGAADWLISGIQGCRGGGTPFLDRTRVPLFRSSDGTSLYTLCNPSNQLTAVVRIPLQEDGTPVTDQSLFEFFPGPVGVTEAWADPAAERMVILAAGGGGTGQQAWVFDGKASRYVGAAGLTQAGVQNGYGFDTSTGRLYVLAPDHAAANQTGDAKSIVPVQGGLMSVDTRINPVPQPFSFPELARIGEPAIRVDPPAPGRPRRIFVRRAAGSEMESPPGFVSNPDGYFRYPDGKFVQVWDEDFYLVIEDRLPISRQPSLEDLDRLTIDVREKADVTTASFDGTGSAYGIRSRIVGGVGTLARTPQTDTFEDTVADRNGLLTPCWFTDREAVGAWVAESRLSDLQANARSVSFDTNGGTKVDLERPMERCETTPNPPAGVPSLPSLQWSTADDAIGQKWDDHFKSVECAGDGERSEQGTLDGFSSTTACRQKDGSVESLSRASVSVPGGAVSVGDAYGVVRVRRDPDGGFAMRGGNSLAHLVLIESLAEARNVVVGEGSINLVRAESTVWSNGRPSEVPRARFTRTICGLRAPGYRHEGCLPEDEMQEGLTEFNKRVLGQRGEIRLPQPDAVFKAGSSKGYVAGITKRSADVFNDQLLNGDYLLEVPALEIVLYRDSASFGPGRQIVQIAGVRGVATYGIGCLPTHQATPKGCIPLPVGADPILPSLPPVEPPPVVDPVTPPPGSLPSAGAVPSSVLPPPPPIERIIQGARQILMRSLSEGLLAAGVWMTLVFPLFLASRRSILGCTFGRGGGA